MPSVFGNGWSPQNITTPLTAKVAPADTVRQLFLNRAYPMTPSRDRILQCRDLRRNITSVQIDKSWLDGDNELAAWISTFSPERQMTSLNLTNTLGDDVPVLSRKPIGQTDRAMDDADEAEVFVEALKRELVDWDEIIGTLVDDSELGIAVYPSPAGLEMAPDFMTTIDGDDSKSLRKPNPKYDRDKDGRGTDHPKYDQRSERASIKAWKDEYDDYLATKLPICVQLIKATDCAPIFGLGMGRQRLECRGMVVRQLYDREELLSQGFRSDLLAPHAIVPSGFNPDRTTGQHNQFYLYTAFVYEVDEKTGERTPFIARCVGGEHTEIYNKHTDENESTVINLKEEYGLNTLMVSYFWGLHYSDDDPAYRGCPILWPVLNTILSKEGIKSTIKAHAWDNAFTGHVATPDPALGEKVFLDTNGELRTFKKPKGNQIVQSPGPTAPWAKAEVGQDAWRLLEHDDRTLIASTPDPQQFGDDSSDSGHAMVVGHELLNSAKRQIKEGGRLAVEFIIESAVELLCGLARGKWAMTDGYRVNACIAQDVERTIDRTGAKRTVSEIIEFKERWFGSNYSVTAKYPATGNLADRRQKFDDWQSGAGTFREMRESRGDQSPETTRFEIARDKWIESPIGQTILAALVAKKRGQMELAAKLQAQVDGEMSQLGVPTDARAPEFAAGPPAGGPGQLPDTAASSLNGAIQGEMGTASRMADAEAQMQVAV